MNNCADGSGETAGGPSDLEQRLGTFSYAGSVLDVDMIEYFFASRAVPGMEGHVRLWVSIICEFLEAVQATPEIRNAKAESVSNLNRIETIKEKLGDAVEFFFETHTDPTGLSLEWLCDAISAMARVELEASAVRRYARLLYDASLTPGARRPHKLRVPTGTAQKAAVGQTRRRDLDKVYRSRRIATERVQANG